MELHGDLGTATSKSRTPNQSMMLVLSITEMLDGFRRLLSQSKKREYEFVGVDCSFRVVFRKQPDGDIGVHVDNRLIHVAKSSAIKADIERSILGFVRTHELSLMTNHAESYDFENALKAFREYSVG